jgi:hypothetical protein
VIQASDETNLNGVGAGEQRRRNFKAKCSNVLRGMGLSQLPKNQKAIEELSAKGMAPK